MREWSATDRSKIADLLRQNLSGAQIARHFQGATRNMIIGLVHRDKNLKAVGFARKPGEPLSSVPKPKRKRSASSVPTVEAPPPAAKQVRVGDPQTVGQPIINLPLRGRCKFPVNNVGRHELHLFCGLPCKGSWCEFHKTKVFDTHRKTSSTRWRPLWPGK